MNAQIYPNNRLVRMRWCDGASLSVAAGIPTNDFSSRWFRANGIFDCYTIYTPGDKGNRVLGWQEWVNFFYKPLVVGSAIKVNTYQQSATPSEGIIVVVRKVNNALSGPGNEGNNTILDEMRQPDSKTCLVQPAGNGNMPTLRDTFSLKGWFRIKDASDNQTDDYATDATDANAVLQPLQQVFFRVSAGFVRPQATPLGRDLSLMVDINYSVLWSGPRKINQHRDAPPGFEILEAGDLQDDEDAADEKEDEEKKD